MGPILPISRAVKLSSDARFRAFCKYAGYVSDAPEASRRKYAIHVGSVTLYSDDTHDLREKFYKHIAKLKRDTTRKVQRTHNANSRRNTSKMQRRR